MSKKDRERIISEIEGQENQFLRGATALLDQSEAFEQVQHVIGGVKVTTLAGLEFMIYVRRIA